MLLPGWSTQIPLTINNLNGAAVTNTVIPIDLSKIPGFNFATALANGFDLRVLDSNGTILNIYRAGWSQAGNTGVIWALVPSLAANSNNHAVYINYGNASAADVSSLDNTFTRHTPKPGDFASWNCTEGAGAFTADSTANGRNLYHYTSASATAPTGNWSWGGTPGMSWNGTGVTFSTGSYYLTFNGTSEYGVIGSSVTAGGATPNGWSTTNGLSLFPMHVSFMFWIKIASAPGGNQGIVFQSYGNANSHELGIFINNSRKIVAYGSDIAATVASNTAVGTGAWHLVAANIGASGVQIWIDSVADANNSTQATALVSASQGTYNNSGVLTATNASPMAIGCFLRANVASSFFAGNLCGLTVSNRVLSNEAVLAEFQLRNPNGYNQHDKWVRSSAPVLSPSETWEGGVLGDLQEVHPRYIYNWNGNGQWTLVATYTGGEGASTRVGLVTSIDSGVTWIKYASNPILSYASQGSHIPNFKVDISGTQKNIMYMGQGEQAALNIQYATTVDDSYQTGWSGATVCLLASAYAGAVDVLYTPTVYKMSASSFVMYCQAHKGNQQGEVRATSTDGKTWTPDTTTGFITTQSPLPSNNASVGTANDYYFSSLSPYYQAWSIAGVTSLPSWASFLTNTNVSDGNNWTYPATNPVWELLYSSANEYDQVMVNPHVVVNPLTGYVEAYGDVGDNTRRGSDTGGTPVQLATFRATYAGPLAAIMTDSTGITLSVGVAPNPGGGTVNYSTGLNAASEGAPVFYSTGLNAAGGG